MTIDPASLPEETVVESHCSNARDCFHYDTAGATADMGRVVVRTFSPDPLPSQEVPRDEWANIKPGSRVRIVETNGDEASAKVRVATSRHIYTGNHFFHGGDVERVFVLDEPADPDADLIERMAAAYYNNALHNGDLSVENRMRAALAVVRESEVGA